MATDLKQTMGQRSKKTSVIALGLVAILAGVAVAFFLTTQDFEDNFAKGGELTVNADMDLDFTGGADCHTPSGTAAPDHCDVLYPTNKADGTEAALTETFSITNDNPVETSYILWATCPGCSDTTLADSALQAEQFNQLMIKIEQLAAPPAATDTCQVTGLADMSPCPKNTTVFLGFLRDMTAADFANLGKIAAGGTKNYSAKLWLNNDAANEQPQTVLSQWTFHVGATLPPPA